MEISKVKKIGKLNVFLTLPTFDCTPSYTPVQQYSYLVMKVDNTQNLYDGEPIS